MSYISNAGEQSTSAELLTLTNLTDLATSGVGEFLRKTGINTFENATVTVTIPTATASVLGGIKVGARLTMAGDVLSADVQTTDISSKVTGPASATDLGVALFDGVTGKLIKNSTDFVQLANGNVGIGTTNPNALLDVAGNTLVTGGSAWSLGSVAGIGTTAKGWMLAYDTTNDLAWLKSLHNNTAYKPLRIGASDISFWTNTASLVQRMTINVNGNVGIGTTTPTASLEIKAGTASLAPLGLIAGPVLTNPLSGKIEFDGVDYWMTV